MKTSSILCVFTRKISAVTGIFVVATCASLPVVAQDAPVPSVAPADEPSPADQPASANIPAPADQPVDATRPPAPADQQPVDVAAQAVPGDNEILPATFSFDRYKKLIDASPFAPAAPAVQVVPAQPGFAQNLYISGMGRIGDKDYVSIASKADQKRIMLVAGEPGPDGMKLESVDWQPERGKSKATIKMGTEAATVEFDQMAIGAAGQGPMVLPPMGNTVDATRPAQVGYPRGRTLPQHSQQITLPGTPAGPNKPVQRRRVRIVPPTQPPAR